ncbi:DapH/DapD/GlmU-related protein [Sphingomonas sp. I4]
MAATLADPRAALLLQSYLGMSLHPTVRMSMTAKFDRTYPRGMHIGEKTYVAFGAAILTHDMTRGMYVDTVIGRHCFIGAKSLIMPGVRIGDESIVAAGAVVTRTCRPLHRRGQPRPDRPPRYRGRALWPLSFGRRAQAGGRGCGRTGASAWLIATPIPAEAVGDDQPGPEPCHRAPRHPGGADETVTQPTRKRFRGLLWAAFLLQLGRSCGSIPAASISWMPRNRAVHAISRSRAMPCCCCWAAMSS